MTASPPRAFASLTQTLPEKIAAAISDGVISGRYPAGARLVEAALVKEYGVSHGPVRDALRMLQSSGLVTINPFRGAEVTALTVREVKEIYQVRAALVGLRARWIAEDDSRDELAAHVSAPIAKLAGLAKSPSNAHEYTEVSLSINRMLTESLSNRWLRTTLQALTLQTSRYTRLALASAERRRESARLWRTLLDAIRAGNGERAEKIASTISLATRDAAIRHLQQSESRPAASNVEVIAKAPRRRAPAKKGAAARQQGQKK
jgi:DNA-binding GntR family transcriptional regulator